MANKKVKILGRELTVFYNWHTTDQLYEEIRKDAVEKDISLNAMLNAIVYEKYFKKQKATK